MESIVNSIDEAKPTHDQILNEINTVLAEHEARNRGVRVWSRVEEALRYEAKIVESGVDREDYTASRSYQIEIGVPGLVRRFLWQHFTDRSGPGEAAQILQALYSIGIIRSTEPVPTEKLLMHFIEKENNVLKRMERPLIEVTSKAEPTEMTQEQHLLDIINQYIDRCKSNGDTDLQEEIESGLSYVYSDYANFLIDKRRLNNLPWLRRATAKAKVRFLQEKAQMENFRPTVVEAEEQARGEEYDFDPIYDRYKPKAKHR